MEFSNGILMTKITKDAFSSGPSDVEITLDAL